MNPVPVPKFRLRLNLRFGMDWGWAMRSSGVFYGLLSFSKKAQGVNGLVQKISPSDFLLWQDERRKYGR